MNRNAKPVRRNAHLQYHRWCYVLLAVLSVLIWTTVFQNLAKPAKNEKVGIVFFGQELDASALHAELSSAIGDLTDQKIEYVDVFQTMDAGNQLGSVLMARSYDYDLLVLSGETMDHLHAYGFFAPLPEQLPQSLKALPTYSQTEDGITAQYGLEAYRPGSQSRFSAFCSGDRTYYIFMSKESVNLAGLNGKGNPEDDAALRVLEYLLEEDYGTEN